MSLTRGRSVYDLVDMTCTHSRWNTVQEQGGKHRLIVGCGEVEEYWGCHA